MRKTKQQQNRQLFLIYGIIYVFLVYLCIVFAPYWTGTLIDLSLIHIFIILRHENAFVRCYWLCLKNH